MPTRLAGVFQDQGIVTKEVALSSPHEPLLPEEMPAVRNAVEKRRREFAAGRSCARRALVELGFDHFPLLVDKDRAPIWPSSVVGSITHTDGCPHGYCAVAVADRRIAMGLGIDAEPSQPLPLEIWQMVLDDDERWDATHAAKPGVHARLVFSAKETTYKALFPTFGRFLEFSDVHIDLSAQQGVFFAELTEAAKGHGMPEGRLMGRFVIDDDLLVTGMVLPAAGLSLAQEQLSLHYDSC
jgi:4'-phosphopantetheinyl transferase EntD